ncbi:MAG TPA: ATP-binding protein [Anaerolineales bacterium]|nr:ATP-binding protein [Anaerolineales bacterium]
MDDKTIPLSEHAPGPRLPVEARNIEPGKNLNYRALFDQTQECVFIIGLDLTYIAANQQALQLLRYEEKELVGMPVGNVMSLDEQLTHASLGEAPNLYERILKRKDGTTVPVEVSTSLVYTAGREPAYIQSIARDISERKNAEEMLRKQARILSVISEATARLLQSSNIESRIPEVLESLGRAMNVFCCAIFEITTFSGRSSIEVQYEWITREHSGFKVADTIAPHLSSILNETSGHYYDALDKMNSGDFSFGVMPIQNSRGLWSFLGLFSEPQELSWSVSEREAVRTAANLIGSALQRNDYEEAVRLSEARNRIILSALPDLLIRVDSNGTILDYSARPEHPLYVHRDVISGKRLAETWPEEVARQIIGELSPQGFESPRVVERFSLPFSSDEYEASLYPINSREALIVIRDITERVQLDEMKSDFINRASHELRTPVTAAILMAELIQEGGTAQELDEYWHTLKSELNRQKILIDRLLIAGRLESGMLKLEHVPLDLAPVLAESVQAVAPIAKKRNVAIQLHGTAAPLAVLGDKGGLEQVFINLINNAVKFSPEGKTVNIELTEHAADVGVSIIDHGLGIPAEAASHLFERFYRAKNVTISEIPGSGIGLYIVKSIVEELDGKITVESVINEGTTFIVTLKKAR